MPPVSSPVSNAVMLRPPQQWAVIAAWISALAGLAPVAWRVHMLIWGAGLDLAPDYRSEPILMGYVVGLCVIEAIASLVVFGLVRPWGEVCPGWLPFFGGRRIPSWMVITVATLGAMAVTVIVAMTAYQLIMMTIQGISNPVLQVHGWHRWFLLAHYGPWPLWPLGLWIAIIAYARRWYFLSGMPRSGVEPSGEGSGR